MARYIDATLLKAEFTGNFIDTYSPALIKAIIDGQPTADVVQVVRCKDCKYFSEFQHCGVLGFCEPNEYCSRGERRKEDG